MPIRIAMTAFPRKYDVVVLAVPVGPWPEGTKATVVERRANNTVLLEFVDERGRTRDLREIPIVSLVGGTPAPGATRWDSTSETAGTTTSADTLGTVPA